MAIKMTGNTRRATVSPMAGTSAGAARPMGATAVPAHGDQQVLYALQQIGNALNRQNTILQNILNVAQTAQARGR